VVATAQTGTGKTLAFVLPMLEALMGGRRRPGVQAIILSPTRELAMQIQETFVKVAVGTGVSSAVIVGGMNERPQIDAIKRGAQVLIATPGRLEDFLQRKLVQPFFNRILVLDEADRMLDMGFLPSLQRIIAAIPAQRQTLFFSATIEKSVAHLVEKHVNNPVRVAIGVTTEASAQVELHAYEIHKDSKTGLLTHLLDRETGTFLVFARTKHGAERLSRQLDRMGFAAASIHGNRSQAQRNKALKGFQDGEYRVLVATDVASRGIHVDGIAHVVNYDLPQVPEDFIHRVGRTGRAGQTGIASTFIMPGERAEVRRIEKALNTRLAIQQVPRDVMSAPRDEERSNGAPRAQAPRAETRSAKPAGPASASRPAATPHGRSRSTSRAATAPPPQQRDRRRRAASYA
jgi:ATP-dependent RNA helicase RhlE